MYYSVPALEILFVFALGAIVGSFLNVVILRMHTGKKITGRSHCANCGKNLVWHELVPIFSFTVLRGKCLKCRSKISFQYPLVEIITGTLFAILFWKYSALGGLRFHGLLPLFFLFSIASVFIVIAVYDIKHTIIPDEMSLLFVLLSFGYVISLYGSEPLWMNIAAGLIISAFFFVLWFVSGGRWMGLGDAKFAFGIGIWLGIGLGIDAVVLAFWIGASVAILILLAERFPLRKTGRGITMKSEIPFGPFLALGSLVAYLFEPGIFSHLFIF